jgi:hypothetical protein
MNQKPFLWLEDAPGAYVIVRKPIGMEFAIYIRRKE